MPDVDWRSLVLLTATVLMAALYGLSASGHFPAEFRAPRLQRGWGFVALWGSMLVAGLAAAMALIAGWRTLPWYAIVIGVGAALLFAPMALQPMPDRFVNGRRGLIVFAAGAMLLAALMWRAT